GGVNALALRIGAAMQVCIALALFGRLIYRAWGAVPATIAVIWCIAGPRWFFEMTYAPLSAEQMFFLGAVILHYADRSFTTYRQWFILGALTGLGWWAHRGTMFAVLPAIITIVAYDRLWRGWRRIAPAMAAGAAGILVGLIPLFIGRAQIDQRLYNPITARWSLFRVIDQARDFMRTDVWTFLGTDGPFEVLCAVVLVALITAGSIAAVPNRTAAMLIGLAMTAGAFWLLSPDAHSGAMRYLMLALPVAYALAGRGIGLLVMKHSVSARGVAALAFCVVTAHLFASRHTDVVEISQGHRESHYQWPGVDPRPALAAIRQQHYAVCYADFWIAYKLEWLSDTGVQFIPYRSVDRTQRRSRQLARSPARKCFVESDGTVRPLANE
ncbi:MAG TPA: hypothetical protein VJZ00_24725, partial [Thermoanaerobaculia bacterium]|nr:hypothetical protein [Thermoanaerobaculia bacterium]